MLELTNGWMYGGNLVYIWSYGGLVDLVKEVD